MTGSAEKRTRTSRPKRRTGCITCKRRHIRCDETKPACRTCIESRRQCEGYREPEPQRNRQLAEHTNIILRRAHSEPRALAATPDGPSIPPSMARMFGSDAERHALDFYLHASALCLSSWPSARAFWTQTLPSISFSSPPIKHCIMAIAGWHAQIRVAAGSEPVVPESFACQQYASALQAMSQTIVFVPTNNTSALVALIACLLLAVCESLQGRTAQLRIHLRHSLDIVRQSPTNASPDFAVVKFLLGRLLLGDMMTMNPDSMAAGPAAHAELSAGSGFSPLTVLAEAANNIHVDILKFAWAAERPHSPGSDRPIGPATLADRAARFDDRLAAAAPSLQDGNATAVQALAAEHSLARLALIGAANGLAELDAHTASFVSVLDSLEAALPSPGGAPAFAPAFAVGLGLAPLMFRTALLCRDSMVRRRAIALLGLCARREGVWQAAEAAAVAELVVTLEERAAVWNAARQMMVVPEETRVRWVEFVGRDRPFFAAEQADVDVRLFVRDAHGALTVWAYNLPLATEGEAVASGVLPSDM